MLKFWMLHAEREPLPNVVDDNRVIAADKMLDDFTEERELSRLRFHCEALPEIQVAVRELPWFEVRAQDCAFIRSPVRVLHPRAPLRDATVSDLHLLVLVPCRLRLWRDELEPLRLVSAESRLDLLTDGSLPAVHHDEQFLVHLFEPFGKTFQCATQFALPPVERILARVRRSHREGRIIFEQSVSVFVLFVFDPSRRDKLVENAPANLRRIVLDRCAESAGLHEETHLCGQRQRVEERVARFHVEDVRRVESDVLRFALDAPLLSLRLVREVDRVRHAVDLREIARGRIAACLFAVVLQQLPCFRLAVWFTETVHDLEAVPGIVQRGALDPVQLFELVELPVFAVAFFRVDVRTDEEEPRNEVGDPRLLDLRVGFDEVQDVANVLLLFLLLCEPVVDLLRLVLDGFKRDACPGELFLVPCREIHAPVGEVRDREPVETAKIFGRLQR